MLFVNMYVCTYVSVVYIIFFWRCFRQCEILSQYPGMYLTVILYIIKMRAPVRSRLRACVRAR